MKSSLAAGSCIALLAISTGARAQASADPFRMVFSYDRPGLQVPHWQITIPPRGPAEYTATSIQPGAPGQMMFAVSPATRARLSSLLGRSNGLQPCETKTKNLANMGAKAVQYQPSNGAEVHCTFNYTDNKALAELADFSMAIANTVQAGLELERLHRYDRLGLDPVMTRLTDDVKSGRAANVAAIRPMLESITTDVALLDRVRSKAQQLLTLAKQQDTTATDSTERAQAQ